MSRLAEQTHYLGKSTAEGPAVTVYMVGYQTKNGDENSTHEVTRASLCGDDDFNVELECSDLMNHRGGLRACTHDNVVLLNRLSLIHI